MSTQVPGFTPEQSYILDVVAERAARRVVAELKSDGCPFECKDMEAVKTVVFGSTEKNIVGLDQQVANNSGTIKQIRRVTWIAVSAFIVSSVGLMFTVAQIAILGR
jgi:hypothetical protein